MTKLNWSVQLVEISRSEFWYKKLAQIPIGSYESYLKLVVPLNETKTNFLQFWTLLYSRNITDNPQHK